MTTYSVSFKNGKIEHYDSESKVLGLHRVDGPAIEWPNGDLWYCQYNKLHRTDGPAIHRPDGNNEFWVDGVKLSKERFDSMFDIQQTVIPTDEKTTEIVIQLPVDPPAKKKKK